MKKCSKCKKILPLNDFNKRKNHKDGLSYVCRKCINSVRNPPDYNGYKKCKKCGATKDRVEFHVMKKSSDGLRTECAKCCTERSKLRSYKIKYNITNKDYDVMLEKQNGKCAICKTDKPLGYNTERFSVDHCHKTGKIRGLLCSKCNFAIGHLNDNVELLKSAIDYLNKYNQQG